MKLPLDSARPTVYNLRKVLYISASENKQSTNPTVPSATQWQSAHRLLMSYHVSELLS